MDSLDFKILYGSQDLEICVHECRATVEDDLYVATLVPARGLRLLDLTTLIEEETDEFESLDMAIHLLFLAADYSYEICRSIAKAAFEIGYDGIVYPSYYSLVRTGAVPFDTVHGITVRRFPSQREAVQSQTIGNIGVFGRPVEDGLLEVGCINRLSIAQAAYDLQFGPVLC